VSQTPNDIEHRLVFAALLPAVRLATTFSIPLRGMKSILELAAYKEVRRRNLKMTQIREIMDVGMTKVGELSRQLKSQFSQPDTQYGLPRRILALLWAMPLTELKIAKALPEEEPEDVSRALAELVEQGAVLSQAGRRVDTYRAASGSYYLVRDEMMSRIDALQNLMHSVVQVSEARFLNDDTRAFSRNLGFRVRPEDLPQLQKLYEEHIFPLVCALDEAATGDESSVPLNLSVFWAPDESADSPEGE